MKSPLALILLPILMTILMTIACVTVGPNPNAPIVGEWEAASDRLVFNLLVVANGNVVVTQTTRAMTGPQITTMLGAWMQRKGVYEMTIDVPTTSGPARKQAMTGEIDEDGNLVLTLSGQVIVLTKIGSAGE
jgi:hypothetical protein